MLQRRRSFVGMVLGFALTSLLPEVASAAPSDAVIRWINELRARENLSPLAAYADLTDDAEAHSATMAQRGVVFHYPSLATATSGYAVLTQFEARAHTLSEALKLALGSDEHHDQVYGDYDRIGVGVGESGGFVYVTWFFMKTRAASS